MEVVLDILALYVLVDVDSKSSKDGSIKASMENPVTSAEVSRFLFEIDW